MNPATNIDAILTYLNAAVDLNFMEWIELDITGFPQTAATQRPPETFRRSISLRLCGCDGLDSVRNIISLSSGEDTRWIRILIRVPPPPISVGGISLVCEAPRRYK